MGMWGRKEQDQDRPAQDAAPKPTPPTKPAASAAPARAHKGIEMEEKKAVIGPSIQIKGELIGQEDLAIEGRVEGLIRLTDHELVVGKKARIEATLEAKTIKVLGEVRGDVVAADRVELSEGSSVTGDIISPRIAIADGARFKGTVDMDRSKGAGPGQPKPPASGASAPKPAGGAPAS